jgi:tetratricopeptide (TPR) repeat protein
VRKAGNRLRITGQLIDTESGAHLWADKFDSALQDVFELQDLVTEAVAGAIEPSVTQAEIKRAGLKPTSNLQAYDYLHQAMGRAQLFTYKDLELAMQLARKATDLDPNYAQAYAHIASWYHLKKVHGWMDDEIQETEEGVRLAHLAVQLEPNDPIVLTEAGFAVGHLNVDLRTAIPWFDRAIALNSNSALAFGKGAIVRTFAGNYVTAADHADRALRLSPFDAWRFVFSLARGISHLMRLNLPEAIEWLRKAAQENPRHSSTYLYLASALAYSGQMTEAQGALARLLELRPMSSATWQRQRRLILEDDYEYALAGARMAGLPE